MPYRLREPEYYAVREAAYGAVSKALRTGELVRPAACEECGGSYYRIEGHHRWGYETENALRVVWLCGLCHWREHGEMRDRKRAEGAKAWIDAHRQGAA